MNNRQMMSCDRMKLVNENSTHFLKFVFMTVKTFEKFQNENLNLIYMYISQ